MVKAREFGERSTAIVTFIGHLLPIFIEEPVQGVFCARDLRDGTLVRPVAEPVEDEDGRVEIWWQGDPARQTVVQGVFFARLALSDYVEFHSRGKPDRYRSEIEHLVEHFRLKTGQGLALPEDPLLELIEAFSKGLDKLGMAALLAAIKKTIGF